MIDFRDHTHDLNIENILAKFELIALSKGSIDVGENEIEKYVDEKPEKMEEIKDSEFSKLILNTKSLLNDIAYKDEMLKTHKINHMHDEDWDKLKNQNENVLNNVRKMSEIKFRGNSEKQKEIIEQT